ADYPACAGSAGFPGAGRRRPGSGVSVGRRAPRHGGSRPVGEEMDEAGIAESLRNSTLFARADAASLRELALHLRRRRFRRNEVIFHQGDPGDSLHVVTSGSLKVVLPSAEGEEAIIATLRPGDFFGELALLDGAERSATVIALEPAETMTLPRTAFHELLDA